MQICIASVARASGRPRTGGARARGLGAAAGPTSGAHGGEEQSARGELGDPDAPGVSRSTCWPARTGGGRPRLIATLHDPAVIRKILVHLGLAPSRPIGSGAWRTPSCLRSEAPSALIRPVRRPAGSRLDASSCRGVGSCRAIAAPPPARRLWRQRTGPMRSYPIIDTHTHTFPTREVGRQAIQALPHRRSPASWRVSWPASIPSSPS